jgi:hypothetical protein
MQFCDDAGSVGCMSVLSVPGRSVSMFAHFYMPSPQIRRDTERGKVSHASSTLHIETH